MSIDVILPTYKRDSTKSIKSVLNQTCKDFKLFVCLDGDSLKEKSELCLWLCNQENGEKVTVLRHEINKGVSAARNTCIKEGQGELICYLDDDDFWYPTHLETIVDFFEENPDKNFVCTKAWGIKEPDCNEIRAEVWTEELSDGRLKGFFPAPYYNPNMINKTNVAPTLCFSHRRKCFDVGLFDENLPILNDWEIWQRMNLKYKLYHIDKFTGCYSVHGKGVISKHKDKAPLIEKVIRQRKEIKLVSEILEEEYEKIS